MHGRLIHFRTELAALDRPLFFRILHVLVAADKTLVHETLAQYTYTVPLQPRSILCGLIVGVVACLGLDGLMFGLGRFLKVCFRGQVTPN